MPHPSTPSRLPASAAGRIRHGFSLIELILVAVILGTVATVALPRYANALSRYRLDAAARRVVADIEYAQSHAKATSSPAILRFRADLDQINAIGVPDLDNPEADHQTNLAEDPYSVQLASGRFGADSVLVFDGYGRPDSGGTVTLRSGNNQRTITVDGETGEAVIQ